MNTLKKATIKQQLFILSSVSLTALILIIFSTIVQLINIKEELEIVVEEDIPLTEMVTKISLTQLKQSVEFERMLHYGVVTSIGQHPQVARTHYKEAKQKFYTFADTVDETQEKVVNFVNSAISHSSRAEDIQKLNAFLKELKLIGELHHSYEKHVNSVIKLLDEGDIEKAERLLPSVESEEEVLNQKVEAVVIKLEKYTELAGLKAEQHEKSALNQLILIGSISIICIFFLCYFINQSIARNINHASDTVSSIIANLDLSKRFSMTGSCEISSLSRELDLLFDNISKCITSVIHGSNQMASSSHSLAEISTNNTSSINQQFNQTDQVAAAIEELANTAADVAKVTHKATQKVIKAQEAISEGKKMVSSNLSEATSLNTQVNQANLVIQKIHISSQGISAALDTIQSVAEQTNLLALNAAIEAARAGEAGRGFAVVAEEVRNLASRTQGLTDDIRDLISSLQENSDSAIALMQSGRTQANKVVDQTETVQSALSNIAAVIQEISDFNIQVSSAAEQQSAVTIEISQSVNSIRMIAEENSKNTDQTTSTSEELSTLAATLYENSAQFKV